MNAHFVITGAFGFIGKNFVEFVLKHNNQQNAFNHINLTLIDKFTYAADVSYYNLIRGHYPHVTCLNKDINDVTLQELSGCTHIINFAAETHVDNSISDGGPFIKSNINGLYNLLNLAIKLDPMPLFVQISTDEVYGDLKTTGKNMFYEDDVLNPSSFYSASKASGDLMVLSANRTFGLPYLITRSCNNYSFNGQHPEKFIPKVLKCLVNNLPIPVYGDGKQLRQWIDVSDNCQIIFNLIQTYNQWKPTLYEAPCIFNIGSDFACSNILLIDTLAKILGCTANITHVSDRKGHDKQYYVNFDKLEGVSCQFFPVKGLIFKDLQITFEIHREQILNENKIK